MLENHASFFKILPRFGRLVLIQRDQSSDAMQLSQIGMIRAQLPERLGIHFLQSLPRLRQFAAQSENIGEP